MTRRKAIRALTIAAFGALAGQSRAFSSSNGRSLASANKSNIPPLASGAPLSSERLALIERFKKQSEGLENKFDARTHKSDWTMPYRLYIPPVRGRLPLVVYLHGSGGLGDDNLKQLGLGNIFGTRVWLTPENQTRFPSFVLAPQTDRGWAKYDLSQNDGGRARVLPGMGDGSRLALEIIDSSCREFPIDRDRIYVTGQSMGGAGVWNVMTHRAGFFAAAVPLCASLSLDDGTGSVGTPVWAFHGEADHTVPVTASRERIAARRKAGGNPIYTEYSGVDHNVWEWAFTEPELVKWVFAQRRS